MPYAVNVAFGIIVISVARGVGTCLKLHHEHGYALQKVLLKKWVKWNNVSFLVLCIYTVGQGEL